MQAGVRDLDPVKLLQDLLEGVVETEVREDADGFSAQHIVFQVPQLRL